MSRGEGYAAYFGITYDTSDRIECAIVASQLSVGAGRHLLLEQHLARIQACNLYYWGTKGK